MIAPEPLDSTDSVEAAVANGIGVLTARLEAEGDGLWRDFVVPGRSSGSTECISAFVAAQIGNLPEGRRLAQGVVHRLLATQRDSGGWGYREDVPEDCDSTAWFLIAADRCEVAIEPAAREAATRFLLRHQHDDGGFVTYLPAARAFLTPADEAGWFEPEVSVTSSALLALATSADINAAHLEAGRSFLLRHQRGGLWASYWWRGFGYATFHALSAVRAVAAEDARLEGDTAAAVLRRRSATGGWGNDLGGPDNLFSSALALRTVLLATGGLPYPNAEALVRFLLENRARGDAEMLAPGAAAYGRELVLCDSGVVTVAAVLGALGEWRRT